MKKIIFLLLISNLLFSYELKEFVTCKNVKNHTPININSKFTLKDKKVYAFAYFTNIKKNRVIDFVWKKKVNDRWKVYADIKLPIYKGVRWRTYSYITVRKNSKGKWQVDIYDQNNLIAIKKFKIE